MPRYIGKGCGRREDRHELISDPVNWRKNEFIEQTWTILGEIPKIRARDRITEDEAFKTERALIAAIGRVDLGKGPLVNMTNGGEGASGYNHSSETKLLISQLAKNAHFKLKEIYSAALKKSHARPETKNKLSNVMRIAMAKPEVKELHEKIRNDPAIKAKHSDGLHRYWTNPENRKRHSIKMKEICSRPGAYERKSKAMRLALSTPEIKRKLSESAVKGWVKRREKQIK